MLSWNKDVQSKKLNRCVSPYTTSYDFCPLLYSRGFYLETMIIAMVIRVQLFTLKPSETNTKWHCMVTHARLCYRCLLTAGLVDEYQTIRYLYNITLIQASRKEFLTKDAGLQKWFLFLDDKLPKKENHHFQQLYYCL